MSNQVEMGNSLLEGVDILIQKRLEALAFDTTIEATITQIINVDSGIYEVTTGTVTFQTNGDRGFKTGDNVLVNIPQGDYRNTKTIIGRASNLNEDEQPVYYTQPVDRMISVTGNLLSSPASLTLAANGDKESVGGEITDLHNTSGLSYLAISGDFRAALDGYEVTDGVYGIRGEVTYTLPSRAEVYSQSYDFNCKEFFGNIYNSPFFTQQSILLQLPEDYLEIVGITYEFYQVKDSFKYITDNEDKKIPVAEQLSGEKVQNLFVQNLSLSLGLPIEGAGERLIIYSSNNLNYSGQDSATINLRWYSVDGQAAALNKAIPSNAILRWYQKGQETSDQYAGAGWSLVESSESGSDRPFSFSWNGTNYVTQNGKEIVSDSSPMSINKQLNSTRANEQFKAILYFQGEKYVSNIIEYTNTNQTLTESQLNSIPKNGELSFKFSDGSEGRYFLYGPDGRILDSSQTQRQRQVEVLFANSEINDSDIIIEWVNLNESYGSMISIEGGVNNKILTYSIKPSYNPAFGVSTVLSCTVTIPNTNTYTAVVPLYFGRDSGTDYTIDLGIYYRDDYGFIQPTQAVQIDIDEQNNNVLSNSYYISPLIYDGTNQLVDLTTDDQDQNIIFTIPENENYEFNSQLFDVITGSKLYYGNKVLYKIGLRGSCANFWLDEANSINTSAFTVTYKYNGNFMVSKTFPIAVTKDKSYAMIGQGIIMFDSAGYPPRAVSPYSLNIGKENPVLNIGEENLVRNIKFINYENNSEAQKGYLPQVNNNLNSVAKRLTLPQIFVADLKTIPCLIFDNSNFDQPNNILWSQPIIMDIETHASTLLNNWNGELTINTEKKAVLSRVVGAGRKENDGSFTGVFLGDVAEKRDNSLKHTGVYGYKNGEQMYAFKDDGTAFIGGAGRGRLEFDGNRGIIESANYTLDENNLPTDGMQIDLKDGSIRAATLNLQDKLAITAGGQLYIDPTAIIGTYTEPTDIEAGDLLDTNGTKNMRIGTVIKSTYAWAASEEDARVLLESSWKDVPPDADPGQTYLWQRTQYLFNGQEEQNTIYVNLGENYSNADIRKHLQIKSDGVHINGYNNENSYSASSYREAVYGSDSIKFQSIQGKKATTLSEWTQDEMALDNLTKFSLKKIIQHKIEEDGSYSIFFM